MLLQEERQINSIIFYKIRCFGKWIFRKFFKIYLIFHTEVLLFGQNFIADTNMYFHSMLSGFDIVQLCRAIYIQIISNFILKKEAVLYTTTV